MERAHVSLISFLVGIAILILGLLVFSLPEVDQPSLTAPLVCLSIIFTLFWCAPLARYRSDEKVDLFHPSILLMLTYFAYFIFSGVWLWLYHHYDSIWVNLGSRPAFVVNSVFFLGGVSIFSFGLGMRTKLPFSKKSIPETFSQGTQFSKREMRYLILFFLVTGGMFKLYHLSLLGPLSTDVFRYLSPSANRALGINISQSFIMLEAMLDWAALLSIFYYIVRYKETGKTNGWWLILLVVVIIALFDYVVSAKRSGVIPFFLLPLIWYHYIIKRLSIIRAGIFFFVGTILIAGLLMARIVLPLLAQNLTPTDYIGQNPSETLAFYIDTGEWSTFDLIAASGVQRDELLTQAGGPILGFLKYSFSTLIIFIPRALWPGKPGYEDLSQVYYRVLVGSDEGIGFAPTIWGTSFLLFHLAGLMIGMYVLGWLFKGVYVMLQPQNGRPLNVFFYSIFYWLAFQFVRFGTTGFVIIMFVQSMIVGVFAVLFLWRKRRTASVRIG
jgi:oligosaccharide repeat unit polymerase